MPVMIILIVGAVLFLTGLAIGIRVQEVGSQQRERRISAQRRELHERAVALAAYRDVDQ